MAMLGFIYKEEAARKDPRRKEQQEEVREKVPGITRPKEIIEDRKSVRGEAAEKSK